MISDSIINLKEEGLITAPEDDPHVTSELRNQGAPLEASENEEDDPPPTTPTDSKSINTKIFTIATAVTYRYKFNTMRTTVTDM